jgi:hypothetical protein
MDHTRVVSIGATERIRIVYKETLQSFGNNVKQYGTRDQGEKVHQNDGGNSPLGWKRV